jgi:hypothetical protein
MNDERWNRILHVVRNRASPGPLTSHLCSVAKALTHLDHFSICVQTEDGIVSLEGSDPLAVCADQMQNLWGVGPSLSVTAAHNTQHGGVLIVEDVTAMVDPRWPLLGGLSSQYGITSIYAFGLRSGGASVGVITGYSQQAASLTTQQLADGLVLATIVTEVLLGIEAISSAQQQQDLTSTEQISTGPVLYELLSSLPASSIQVHQAAGMLAERLQIGILEAQIRLRALAFRRNDTLEELSCLIIAHHPIPELEA